MASSLIPVLGVTTPAAGAPPAPVTDGEHGGLLQALAAVPDPRDPRGVRYPLAGLLAVAVCAVLAGASSFAAIADWLHDLDEQAKARLGFGRGVPVGTTVWRLLTRVDAGLLTAVLAAWLRTRVQPDTPRPKRYRTVIAVDGKTLRAARRPDGSQVHLLSALDTSTGIVLAQVTVEAKSNEIPAFAPLLDAVAIVLGDLTGVLFVADALQHPDRPRPRDRRPRRSSAGPGQSQPAHPVRPTQTPALAPDPARDRTRDRGHGRRETRTVKAVTVHTPGGIAFPHAEQAIRITRTRTLATSGKTSRENAYLTVSLPATDAQPDDLQTGSAATGTSKTASITYAT